MEFQTVTKTPTIAELVRDLFPRESYVVNVLSIIFFSSSTLPDKPIRVITHFE